jgi:FkbM family methyltransferase
MLASWRSRLTRRAIATIDRALPHAERLLPRAGVDVLDIQRAAAPPPPRRHLEVVKVSQSTVVVSRPRLARQERLHREKRLFQHLAASHVAGVLEHYRVNCVLDVGGNRGQYGRMLRALGYKGRIVSFEPVGHLHAKLALAARRDPHWSVHRMALGSENGTTAMHVVPETAKGWRAGLSSVLPPTSFGSERYPELAELSSEQVQLRRLDGMLEELTAGLPEPRLYLKLDTQGYDLEVFEGLGDRTGEVVAMQSELALAAMYEGTPHMSEALRTYEQAGLSVSGMFLVSRNWTTWAAVEYDCVLVREAALGRQIAD